MALATAAVVLGLDGPQQPLAGRGDRQIVVGDHGDPLAEVGDQLLAEIDLRTAGIVVHALEGLLPDALFADDFVVQGAEVVEGVEDIDVDREVGGHVAADPGLRSEVLAVGKDEHLHRFRVRRRGEDGGAMEDLVAVGGNVDVAAHALEGRVALVAHDFDDRLALAPLFRRRGGPGRLGEAQGIDVPADAGHVPGGVGRAALHDHLIRGNLGKAAGWPPVASRARISCTTARSSQAPKRFSVRK